MSKRRRARSREDILKKRRAEDARRSITRPKSLPLRASGDVPGHDILYNPLELRVRNGGIVLIRGRI